MAAYKISGPALQDLREIHDWISRDDRDAADRVLLDLREAMEMLAGMPGLGHIRDDLAAHELRA